MPLPFTPPLFDRFEDSIRSLPPLPGYEPKHLCTPQFRLFADDRLEMFYAPFDFVNRAAKIAIVGITPGFQQMEIAFRTSRAVLVAGGTPVDACSQAKAHASFAGTMRSNLTSMLAEIGLLNALAVSSPATLFDTCGHLLHMTSAIRYPVFVRGANYTGHTPRPLDHPLLRGMIFDVLAPELAEVPDALVIPLGKAVGDCLLDLIKSGVLNGERCLLGFPHPSGGNGHRKRQLEQHRDMLKTQIASWFTPKASTVTA